MLLFLQESFVSLMVCVSYKYIGQIIIVNLELNWFQALVLFESTRRLRLIVLMFGKRDSFFIS